MRFPVEALAVDRAIQARGKSDISSFQTLENKSRNGPRHLRTSVVRSSAQGRVTQGDGPVAQRQSVAVNGEGRRFDSCRGQLGANTKGGAEM